MTEDHVQFIFQIASCMKHCWGGGGSLDHIPTKLSFTCQTEAGDLAKTIEYGFGPRQIFG